MYVSLFDPFMIEGGLGQFQNPLSQPFHWRLHLESSRQFSKLSKSAPIYDAAICVDLTSSAYNTACPKLLFYDIFAICFLH